MKRIAIGALLLTVTLVAVEPGLAQGKGRRNQGNRNQGLKNQSVAQISGAKVSSPIINLGTAAPTQAKPLGDTEVKQSSLKIAPRSVIRFQPKALTEDGKPSGKPVSPTLAVNVGPGKTAQAGDLVDGTNGLESELNKLGYSLYDKENDSETPLVPITPVTVDMKKQANEFAKVGGMSGTLKVPVTRSTSSEVKSASMTIKAAPTNTIIVPKTVNETHTLFIKELGDHDWFAIDFDASLHKHADMKLRKLTAKADINAYLIGHKASLFHALAEVGGTKDYTVKPPVVTPGLPGGRGLNGGRQNGKGGRNNSSSSSSNGSGFINLEATLLGDDLISPVHKTTSGNVKRNLASKSVGFEYSIHVPVVPLVTVVGTIGVKGKLGLDLALDADSTGGNISVIPSFDTEVYAQAGVSIGIVVVSAEGGLGANLTLLDYDLTISAGVGTQYVNKGDKTYIGAVTPISVSHTLNTLKGKVYGYAKITYWLPFKNHEKTLWRGDLFNWSGFTDSRVLYSQNSEPVIVGESPVKVYTIDTNLGN